MTVVHIPWTRWQESGRVGACVELHDVRLHKLTTRLHDFAPNHPLLADLSVDANISREPGASFAVVSVDYKLRARFFADDQNAEGEDVEPEGVAAEVKLRLVALYEIREPDDGKGEFTEDELTAFAESTGLMALHPYARELLQDQTARMGLPALTIGVARIAQ